MSHTSPGVTSRRSRPTVYVFVALGALVGLTLAISQTVILVNSTFHYIPGVGHRDVTITVELCRVRIYQKRMPRDEATDTKLCFESIAAVVLACLGAAGGLAFAERR